MHRRQRFCVDQGAAVPLPSMCREKVFVWETRGRSRHALLDVTATTARTPLQHDQGIVVPPTPSATTTPLPYPLFRAALSPPRRHRRQAEFYRKLSTTEPRGTTTIATNTPPLKIPSISLQDGLAHVMVFPLAKRQAVKRRCAGINKRGVCTSGLVTNHRDTPRRLQHRFPRNERTRLRQWHHEILISTWEVQSLRLSPTGVRSRSRLLVHPH